MFGTEYSNVSTWITNSPAVLTAYSPSTANQISSIIHYSNHNRGIKVRKSFLSYPSADFPDTRSDTLSKHFCLTFVHIFLLWPGRWGIRWKGMTWGAMPKQWKKGNTFPDPCDKSLPSSKTCKPHTCMPKCLISVCWFYKYLHTWKKQNEKKIMLSMSDILHWF